MFKTTLKIDGMACGMCESHINDLIRNKFKVKKVDSSHSKGRTEIISEKVPNEAELKNAIEGMGYKVLDVQSKPYERKKFSFFSKK